MRSLQGCHIVSALMIGCSSVQKHNKKNLRPGGYCPWPHDLRISRYAFRNLSSFSGLEVAAKAPNAMSSDLVLMEKNIHLH